MTIDKEQLLEATEMFKSGFHCSQVIFSFFAEKYDLDPNLALKISSPFGGGIGGLGKICGALTGGMMALGLKFGYTDPNDTEKKPICKQKTRELVARFLKEYHHTECNDLIGFDRSDLTSDQLKERRHIFDKICPKFITSVILITEELLEDQVIDL